MSSQDRAECLSLVKEAHAAGARKSLAFELLGIDLRTLERWETKPADLRCGPKSRPSNALSAEEQERVISIANETRFAGLPPGQIVPLLADEGLYVASESTFYRLLKQRNLLVHRGRSQPRQKIKPPALVATKPNEIWSWDITYLRTEVRGLFYYLYLPMDVFSRMIVHWEIHECESAELAGQMMTSACAKHGITRGQLKLHSDNGGPMKGATMLATLQWLGVVPSLSRPRVSDDNPFSESLFKTLKYCPSYPLNGRFETLEVARKWVQEFVHWYNNVHLHSGINWVTPASRHAGNDLQILDQRNIVYNAARAQRPNRWSENTRNWSRVTYVELNPENGSQVNKIGTCRQAS